MKKFEEKTIRSERIYEGKIINLKVDEVNLPNGKTSKRELIEHPGAVAILAFTPENKIIMVEQYRKALERSIIEVPAGKLEKGESPETTAMRELEEETGYSADSLELIQSFSTSPGFADEVVHLFFAEGLRKAESGAVTDEDEFVELMEVTVEEAEEMMRDNRIFDAKTAFAVLWAKQRLSIEN
ncbi:NUDIX hydrolase [Metaplanococcus flavidus]|uniref:NUDIX hydrolase n=1 Tax=Metaplanococcus flavidus TaxID=569883 RepID=A0ABW3L9X2_9BACL